MSEFEPRGEETSVIIFGDKSEPELVILKTKRLIQADETAEPEAEKITPYDAQQQHLTDDDGKPPYEKWKPTFITPEWWNGAENHEPIALPFAKPGPWLIIDHHIGSAEPNVDTIIKPPSVVHSSTIEGHDHQAGTPITPISSEMQAFMFQYFVDLAATIPIGNDAGTQLDDETTEADQTLPEAE